MVRYNSDEITVVTASPMASKKPEASKQRSACLIMLSGNNVGQVYRLRADETTIGRDDSSTIQLMDAGISRRHAKIQRLSDGGYRLFDAGSRNGTFANNHRLEGAHELQDGDKVQVGVMTILKFSYGDDLEASYAQRMYDAALRDDLTGLFNRRYLNERLRSEFSFSRRHDRALSLLLIDLDHFKSVNDTYGHLKGDQVLRETAQRVADIIRVEDVLARYGGEEFCVVCRDTDLMNASILAERIRHQTATTPHLLASEELVVTVSIGGVAIPDPAINTPEQLVDAADEALYQAKASGRNCVITRRPSDHSGDPRAE
ncbi:MAG: GGDEF domain-containing protein [Proteobacteria bacterium]|nr:MAG: GGDEF domain-containing protein [Pseudomonadota bacterium]PIE18561.1 MAG: GGDEF domain-containing protein [Pseudomonadota bacterium]